MLKTIVIAVLLVALAVLVGLRLRVSAVDPIEVASKNQYYGTENCRTVKDDRRLLCSEASCKNALIAQGYVKPGGDIQVYQSSFSDPKKPDFFVHYARFGTEGVTQNVKCESQYMGAVSVSRAVPPRSINK